MSVRVRFAPSPTGFLHIGNARAALINWLFAHRHGGSFMLRLDDTDLERSEERFAEAIHKDMAWLGLKHDQFAKQSDRFDRYAQAMQTLIDSGRLYPCFETAEELSFKRKRQLAKGEPPIYDRGALSLPKDQIKAYESEGRKAHWRFKLLPGKIEWNDLVRGHVEYEGERLSDPVLVREDGAYLYTITSVVDDLDFAITHILRGEDHVSNTAVQIQLFEALNNNKPIHISFGHTTLLMDANGQALSKRLGSLSLGAMREQGVEPMAINSLLARLGTSLPIEPFLDLPTLAETFDLSTFSRNPPHFDEKELYILNQKIFQIMPYSQAKPHLEELGIRCDEKLWNLVRSNIHLLSDISKWKTIIEGDIAASILEDCDEYIRQAFSCLPPTTWDDTTWTTWTSQLKEMTGRKGRELFMPLRKAITGMEHGPEMKELLPMIGYEKVKERLARVAV